MIKNNPEKKVFYSSFIKFILKISRKDQKKNLNAIKNRKKSFLFPWWFKILAYVLSFALIGLSTFFIFVRGIELGNDDVFSWLRSVIVSVIASIFLTSPIKVNITIFNLLIMIL